MASIARSKFFLRLGVIFCLFLTATQAMETHTKFWSAASITGSFNDQSQWRYYLEPQIRFIDNRYKFNNIFLLGGLGYQITPNVLVLAGPGWVLTKNLQGKIIHEDRIWEQLSWSILKNLSSRTRLEERRDLEAPGLAIRLRERLWLRIPFEKWQGHNLSLFDEALFNLNHPSWVSSSFFEQNRAFIGIGTQISKSTMMDIGYLNQRIFAATNQNNHVLLLSFTLNL